MIQVFLKNWKTAVALFAAVLFISGCSLTTTSTSDGTASDSSIFLSTDSGDTWRALASVPTISGRQQTISDLSVNVMSMDPQDSLAVYLGAFDRGLYYTYNITTGWNRAAGLPEATVNDVKVDPKNKCTVYAAIANRLYRSGDCSRTFTQAYFDNNESVAVTAVAVDHHNTRNVYIGTSRGEIIKSIDGGDSWRTIQRLDESVARLVILPSDSRIIFVATNKNHLFRFSSNTDTNPAYSADLEQNFLVENWTDLNDAMGSYKSGSNFKDLAVCAADGAIYLATDKAILRSADSGDSWQDIKLLPAEKDAAITALAVNPKDSNNFYYVTNTAFFRTVDGGATWTSKDLPTKRAGRELLIDFSSPNNIYLGTMKIKN